MTDFRKESIDGHIIACPKCSTDIRYAIRTVWNIPTPFFYCDTCSNVLLRKTDQDRVLEGDVSDSSYIDRMIELWKEILSEAPPCPCGGRFSLWSNVKCSICGYEIPYNSGHKDKTVRVSDSKIIIVDGAVVVGDSFNETWKANIVLAKS